MSSERREPEEVPATPGVDDDGVDRTLIRESLARTPLERLDLADAYAREIEELRALMRPSRAKG